MTTSQINVMLQSARDGRLLVTLTPTEFELWTASARDITSFFRWAETIRSSSICVVRGSRAYLMPNGDWYLAYQEDGLHHLKCIGVWLDYVESKRKDVCIDLERIARAEADDVATLFETP